MDDASNLAIREARTDDVKRAVEVHRSAVLELGAAFYTERQIEAWAAEATPDVYPVDDSNALILVAENGSNVLGVGQLNVDEPEIGKLFVDPDVAGRGIGGRLLERLEEEARKRDVAELFLDASLNAADFYHRHGYDYGTMLDKSLPLDDGEVVYPTLRMWKSLTE